MECSTIISCFVMNDSSFGVLDLPIHLAMNPGSNSRDESNEGLKFRGVETNGANITGATVTPDKY
ncbi:hypothetical protein EJB05_11394, partial [Eragrostis curvula]